jgi:hypothetical protein
VALSNEAQQLLGQLDRKGKVKFVGPLARRLGWTEDVLHTAADELCAAGLAELEGKRLKRIVSAAGISPEAQMMISKLPAEGSTIGGLRLRTLLDVDNETYIRARHELDVAGLIIRGPGKGGTIARTEAKARSSPIENDLLVLREAELYDPFLAWLQSELEGGPGFSAAKRTASAKGWSAGSGKWSRPDVTAVQVLTYEWLPHVTVEVYSYEIKRFTDAQKLESVYEAAAHQRWAHRASLVVELDHEAGELPDAMLDEIRRFRLGLYSMRRLEDGSFEIREVIEPARSDDAQPEDVNEMIDTFLGDDGELRNTYKRWIG